MSNRITLDNGLSVKVYDDSNYKDVLDYAVVNGFNLTCVERNYDKVPVGSIEGAPRSAIAPIPRSSWSAAIKEQAEKRGRVSDRWREGGCKILNQASTNYCWINGVVTAFEAVRACNGMPYVKFSPASGGARIKGFRNVGGWGTEALEWIIKNGITRESLWPANAIDRKYLTPEAIADAMQNRVTEWSDLGGGNFDLQATYALLGKPVAVGYNWWSHEVCQLDLVEIEPGSFGILIANSWGESWDGDGMAVLRESKGRADDAVSPEVVYTTTV